MVLQSGINSKYLNKLTFIPYKKFEFAKWRNKFTWKYASVGNSSKIFRLIAIHLTTICLSERVLDELFFDELINTNIKTNFAIRRIFAFLPQPFHFQILSRSATDCDGFLAQKRDNFGNILFSLICSY